MKGRFTNRPPRRRESKNDMGKPIIELKGITKIFGTGDGAVTALKDVDLTIEEGEIFGVIGLSGAG